MPDPLTLTDYKSEPRGYKTAQASPEVGARLSGQPPAVKQPGNEPLAGPADFAAVEEFLQLLGRAIRQFHTYPPTSPLCVDAITACHKALVSLDGRDRVAFRVTPRELIVDDVGVGAGTVIEQELVRRLHRAHVAAVDIERSALPRDLARFCSDVNRSDEYAKANITLAEQVVEHGVDGIVLRMAHRPEVLDVGAPNAPLRDLVEAERRHREAALASGPVNHLYPPDKGWVRLDPSASFDTISLIDLAVLVEDPANLATMLLRLTDDEPAGAPSRQAALAQKFSDVATLFASMEPRLARVMFARLARAVLELEPDGRKDLLQRTILPGLLDGRAEGSVLLDFPDVDLADSLFLLLDLETAAPEVLTTALDQLQLSAERREIVAPLLEARLRGGESRGAKDHARERDVSIDRYVRKLIRVDATAGKSFAEFSAFDLSMDDQTAAAITGVRSAIGTTDLSLTQLRCLWSLVKLEPSPKVVDGLLRRALTLFADLDRAARWRDLASEVALYQQLAETLRDSRPDVADGVSNALGSFWTPRRALRVAELYETGAEGQALAHTLVRSCGAAMAPALLTLLDDRAIEAIARAIVSLLCEHAQVVAPAVAPLLGQCGVPASRLAIRVLGFAGQGYETTIAEQLGRRDEHTDREALRALARIGTAAAAALVATYLRQGRAGRGAAAEEALWHFAPAHITAQVRDLLGRRDFVLHNPKAAERLLERVAQSGVDGLKPVLVDLAPLRFRFWNPAVVRVALKARGILRRDIC